MSTPKRRFNLLSLTFIVLCFKKSLLIRMLIVLIALNRVKGPLIIIVIINLTPTIVVIPSIF